MSADGNTNWKLVHGNRRRVVIAAAQIHIRRHRISKSHLISPSQNILCVVYLGMDKRRLLNKAVIAGFALRKSQIISEH